MQLLAGGAYFTHYGSVSQHGFSSLTLANFLPNAQCIFEVPGKRTNFSLAALAWFKSTTVKEKTPQHAKV